jgi:3-methyladenine DNA glycosylase AlkD
MTAKETLAELESVGTEQTRKTCRRHGVTGACYGVSYAILNALKKKIKVDHALALELWASGNHDARVLATMIADPKKLDAKTMEAWAKALDNYILTDAVAKLFATSTGALAKAEKWSRAKGEWIARTGWLVLANIAKDEREIEDAYWEEHLGTIERDIHASKNWVRAAMNSALIAIGARNPKLEKRALAAAKRIGKVEVDHGETECKTPDAADYIHKIAARRAAKA